MKNLRSNRVHAVFALRTARDAVFKIGTEDLPGEFDWPELTESIEQAIEVLVSAEEANEDAR